jgi:hypothetical protein|nr:MAG TPA: hypothetical protein [Caudoviricetes sp.]
MASIKFNFYNLFLEQGNNLVANDLTEFIDNLGRRENAQDRTAEINDVVYSMPHLAQYGGARNDGTRFFWIGKFLTEKPYAGHQYDDDFQIMTEDAYSPAMIFYRPADHLLGIQSKQSAPRKKAVEDFFNYFLHEDNRNEDLQIVLYKQPDQSTLDMLEDGTVVNFVSLDVLTNNNNRYFQDLQADEQNPLANIINANARASMDMGSNYCTLTWKKGRFKKALPFQMVQWLREIDFTNESITKGIALVKRPGFAKATKIDLLTDGILETEFTIGDDISAFEAIAVNVNEQIQNNGIPEQCLGFYVQNYRANVIDADVFIQFG